MKMLGERAMTIKEFLSYDMPIGKPNEHGVFCGENRVKVTVFEEKRLYLIISVGRGEEGYYFGHDSFNNLEGTWEGSCSGPSLYDKPYASKTAIFLEIERYIAVRPVFAKSAKLAIAASRELTLFDI